MKGQAFIDRFRVALSGIRAAFASERSFRTQLLGAAVALAALAWLRPPLVWIALVVVMIALVLAAELINTALEHLLDGLHPGEAEFARVAKDCAAAAVLVLSFAAVAVFVLMLAAVMTR